jgi:hypothetical protein
MPGLNIILLVVLAKIKMMTINKDEGTCENKDDDEDEDEDNDETTGF